MEYEWRPPRCDTCKIFGHALVECPKSVLPPNQPSKSGNDGDEAKSVPLLRGHLSPNSNLFDQLFP